ncbi:hypothetical protein GYO_0744 [Bacillus spizizenii TU-B-10]|uniref:Uncharacterized protein n=1 Tax=Bacillus spizizenii (strain DSM 15029 / JCM 12233 / NBRC 101239 / NRRL B-23049 / TU-B-10) TaxID=1052585 RepID=G4NWA1_BACS4|nr:hypothetical protein GYO_0744 [Bacillus spizizenii TU-B-10]SCV39680.1 hypothetical protein BQ1740_1088 [Bacillus subtilis]
MNVKEENTKTASFGLKSFFIFLVSSFIFSMLTFFSVFLDE